MNSKFILKKYRVLKDDNSIFEIDLTQDVYTFGAYKDFFIKDFLNLYSYSPSEITSEFIFEINFKIIKLIKNHSAKSIVLFENDVQQDKNFFEYISKLIGSAFTSQAWSQRLIDASTVEDIETFINNLNSQIKVSKPAENSQNDQKLLNKLKEGQTEEIKQKIDKYIESKVNMMSLERIITSYQNNKIDKESYDNKLKEFKNKKTMLKEKGDSIKILIESRKKLQNEVEKIKSKNFDQIPESIKQKKIHERIEELKSLRDKAIPKDSDLIEAKERIFQGRPLVALVVVQILLTLISFLINPEPNIIVIALVSIFSLVISMFILNFYQESELIVKVSSNQSGVVNEPTQEDHTIFINSAMLGAYISELKGVEKMISARLNGLSVEEFESQLSNLDSEERTLNSESEKFNNSLTPEEYYKKRRELDILKIESENSDSDLSFDKALADQVVQIRLESEKPAENNLIDDIPVLILNLNDLSKVLKVKSYLLVR